MQNDNMEKDAVEETTENPTILDCAPTDQFGLRTFTNEQGKQEYQVVKFDTTGDSGLVVTNVPVTLPDNVSVHVDHAGRLTLQISGSIDGLTGDLGGSGDANPIPTGQVSETAFGKKLTQMPLQSPEPLPSVRTADGVLQMGRVSGILGNVTDFLRMMPEADPLECMEPVVQTTASPTVTTASDSFLATMRRSVPAQNAACTLPVPGMRDVDTSSSEATGRIEDCIVGSSEPIRPVSITEVMGNIASNSEQQGTRGLTGSVSLGNLTPCPLPSLVNIGVPNVELTTTGQLVISPGPMVYADQSSSLLAMPAAVPEMASPLKENAIAPNVQGDNPAVVKPKVKRKGGWPKGKKRKKELVPKVPKAPTTAYSVFLNEQLKLMKEEHSKKEFPEIVKILGHTWTKMPADRKKKYMNAAALDKKRYIDELQAFQHSETYQMLLRRQVAKKIKDLTGVEGATIDPDVSASVLNQLQLEEDDPVDLLCKICDQYFSSVHNKKEHMYGKQHLLTLTTKLCEIEKEVLEMQDANPSMTKPGVLNPQPQPMATEKALQQQQQQQQPTEETPHTDQAGGTSSLPDTSQHPPPAVPARIHIEQFKEGFMELNLDREIELRELRCHDQELFEINMQLSSRCQQLEDVVTKASLELNELKRVDTTLRAKLESLRMVPTLFGVINF